MLVTFAVVTVVAAAAMLVESHGGVRRAPDPTTAGGPALTGAVAVATRTATPGARPLRVVAGCGAAVGFLTGFLGVGGGFLVLPVLVIALRMPLPAAVGTSLLIMVGNSASALVSRIGDLDVDWTVVVPFTLASVVGTLLGRRLADRLPGAALTRIFALLLLLRGNLRGRREPADRIAGHTLTSTATGTPTVAPPTTTAASTPNASRPTSTWCWRSTTG